MARSPYLQLSDVTTSAAEIAKASAVSAGTGAIGGFARAGAVLLLPWLAEKFRSRKKGKGKHRR